MAAKFYEDDYKNQSSFRIIWMPFMVIIAVFFGIVAGLLIREILSGGEYFNELLKTFGVTGSTGIFGLVVAAIRKYFEGMKNPAPQPRPTPQAAPAPAPAPASAVPVFPSPPPYGAGPGIVIDRIYENNIKTLSECGIWNGERFVYFFKGLELPWLNNQVEVSRIPSGIFPAIAALRPNGKYSIRFLEVVGRSRILIHIANYLRDIRGCIAPGLRFADIDGDGVMDVADSGKVMLALQGHFPLGTELTVWVRDRFTETGNQKPA